MYGIHCPAAAASGKAKDVHSQQIMTCSSILRTSLKTQPTFRSIIPTISAEAANVVAQYVQYKARQGYPKA